MDYLRQSNPALNLAPFGRWTLRDKAAQRRSSTLGNTKTKSKNACAHSKQN